MTKIKKTILKTIFFIVSSILLGFLMGSVIFLISAKQGEIYSEYMLSFTKFFMEFLSLSAVIGITVAGFMYVINKVYNKLFN